MPIQYLYPTLYTREGEMPYWYVNGNGIEPKPSESIPTEIDEGVSTVNIDDYLSFLSVGTIAGILDFSRNYVYPSSLMLNICYSSEYFREGAWNYISGASASFILRNRYNTNTVAITSFGIESGLRTKSVPMTIFSTMEHPIDYDMYVSFGTAPTSDFSYNKIYAIEVVSSGTKVIQDNSCTLYINKNTGDFSTMTLYTYGRDFQSGSIDLFVQQQKANSGLDLYTKAANRSSGNITLHTLSYLPQSGGITTYIQQQNGASGLPLHLMSFLNASGDITLHTQAGVKNEGMNLFTYSKSGDPKSGGIDLSVYSSTDSGIFNSIPLTVKSEDIHASMSLVIANTDLGTNNGSLNLVINNEDTSYKYCTLFLNNTAGEHQSGVNFYVAGNGIYNNAYVGTGSMNMVIGREHESIGGGTPFYICGPSGAISAIPFTIDGATITNNNVTISISGHTEPNGNVPLYSHGF